MSSSASGLEAMTKIKSIEIADAYINKVIESPMTEAEMDKATDKAAEIMKGASPEDCAELLARQLSGAPDREQDEFARGFNKASRDYKLERATESYEACAAKAAKA